MQKNYFYVLIMAIGLSFSAFGQQNDMKPLPLEDLSAFRNQAGNWRIVGNVIMDPTVDVAHHAQQAAPVPEKKGKKNKDFKPAPKAEAVRFTEGKGILLNVNDETRKDQLISVLEHGDIELELEVMIPKGSNSGIYLQGRYEVQLLDSWGVKNAKFSDIGGIYRNWETQPGKIYMGKAPLTNAAKAPGLWQKMKISFRAPRFDESGKKIANAKFVSVVLNGVEIHSNVEVPLPTGGPIENNEKPMGPLVIQGDHGPVAFRNIRYKLMQEADFAVSNISYKVYHGNFRSTGEFASAKPALTGTSNELTIDVTDVENAYGVSFAGQVTLPDDARYHFTATYTGGGRFVLNGQELFNFPTHDGWRRDTASIYLKKGTYPIEIYNFKDASWMPPRFALTVRTSTTYPKDLHALSSYPPDDEPTSSILISPTSEPRLLRAFIDFKGNRGERLTHTIGVGDPTGLHYVYDLHSSNLVCVWKGSFVDATPMWHDRGDGSFRPMGATLYLFKSQPLAYLSSQNESFPESAKEGELRGRGYFIDESTSRPIFRFNYRDLEVEDRVFPDENNTMISHEVIVKKGTQKEGLYYKLAEGSAIEQMPDGSFVVNDKEYYIKVGPGIKPFVRDNKGKKELVTAFPQQSLKYSIIW
jgi:hypothetical protein